LPEESDVVEVGAQAARRKIEEMIESLHDRVLLESFEDEMRNSPLLHDSPISIPTQYAETSRLATVIAVGPDVGEDFSAGDVVLCNRYPTSAWAFQHEGRELVSVLEDEILAKIEVKK
jgi:co-chaperonin GroES (HSP10)